jgi:hypothetical protein
MTDRDFVYWLQGFFELSKGDEYNLRKDQVKTINKHIELVEKGREADSFLVGIVSSIGAILKALGKDYTDESSVFAVDCLVEILDSVLSNVTNDDSFFSQSLTPEQMRAFKSQLKDLRRLDLAQGCVDVFEGGAGMSDHSTNQHYLLKCRT